MEGAKKQSTSDKFELCSVFSTDDVSVALKIIKDVPFKVGNESKSPKRALTKINRARNWALGEAEKVVKTFVGTTTKDEIKIDWKARKVLHGTIEMFVQTQDDLKGEFFGTCSSLELP